LESQSYILPLIYRPAQPADARLYFDWANDPVTRQQSFNSESIPWENHNVWFSFKLKDQTARLLVFETQQGEPVGQIRFERRADEVVIGISLDATFRGQGLAPVMIQAAVGYYQTQFPTDNLPIHAYIRPDNPASIRSFEKAGFRFSHESGKFGVQSKVYTVNSKQ
jgi:RimJ/RimL family protein N-acetyltransferase